MKRLIVLIFLASLVFAVETVPRTKKTGDDQTSKGKTEVVTSGQVKKSKNEKEKDSIIDADSNSVNDPREGDLQKIKWLRSRFRELKKKAEESEGSQSKQSRPQKNKRK